MQPSFVEYQKRVVKNAQALATGLQSEGFRIVSGGTDSHVFLMDVFAKGVRGKEAEVALDKALITANRNTIPFDVNKPLNPSGIRLGSPAVTTRGFQEGDMREVASIIATVIAAKDDETVLAAARKRVLALTAKYPLYAWKMAHTTVG